MKPLLSVVLLCVVGVAQTTATAVFSANGVRISGPKMTIIALENDGHFAGAVSFPATTKADQAVVRVYFWTYHLQYGKLLRSRDFVIPVVAGATVMFDEVPAPRKDVRNVSVTLVRNVSNQEFSKFEGDSK